MTSWFERQSTAYKNGHDRPLGGYLGLMGAYAAGTAVVAAYAAARTKRDGSPERFDPWEVAQLAIATHKLARMLAKDPVTSPLRVPFTTYTGTSAPAELTEEVRGHGLQHAVGELITCPMCLGQWVATALTLGLVIIPVPTRLVTATLMAVSGADFLQYLYVRLQQAT